MRKQKGFTALELVIVLFAVIVIIGWVWNIVKIFGSSFDPLTAIVVMRCIGVFVAPLGAVLGYL